MKNESNVVEINIGGEKRRIASYDFILKNQLLNHDSPIMTPFQYETCIFNNFGFTKCPENSYWIKQEIPIELVGQTEVFDQPIASIPTIIIGEKHKLNFMLDLINLWAEGESKSGHLINPDKSFYNKKDVNYCIDHNIQMKIGYKINQEESSWNASDIKSERLHQLNPVLDNEYFENCLCNFDVLSKFVDVEYPFVMFALGIINPDLVTSIIKTAEIITADYITKTEFKGVKNQAATSPNALPLFQKSLNDILRMINNNIYSRYGVRGLIILNRIFNREEKISKEELNESLKERSVYGNTLMEKENYQLMFATGDLRIFDGLPDGKSKEEYVLNIETNSKDNHGRDEIQSMSHYESRIKRVVFTYVDNDAGFPEPIDDDHRAKNSYEYKKVLLRLYIIIKYILDPKYGKVLEGKRLILSKNFYLDENNFALYIPGMNLYMTVDQDYNVDFMTPSEIVKYYNDKYDGEYFIDPEEVECYKSDKIKKFEYPKNFDLIMQNDTFYINGKNEVNLDIKPVVQQSVIQQQSIPQMIIKPLVPEGYNNEENMYSLNTSNLVDNE